MNTIKHYHCPLGEDQCNGCAGEMDALRAIQAKLIKPRKKASNIQVRDAILNYVKRNNTKDKNEME